MLRPVLENSTKNFATSKEQKLRVVYRGREGGRRTVSLPEGDEDILEILSDNWNDYGYETFFSTVCRVGQQRIELDA